MLLGRGLPPVYERKPADAPAPEGRAPHWRFRLDHDAPIVWNDLIRGEQRFDPEAAERPGRPARGRQLALSAAERDRRRRPWRHPRRARRGPCLEQRGADPDVRGARRQAAAVRARGAAGRGRGQAVEAARLLRRRASARGGRRADGAAVGARADRHVAAGRAGRVARRACRRASTSRPSAARPRISIRTRSSWSTRGCSTSSTIAAVADRLPAGATEQDWLLLRGQPRAACRLRRLARRCSTARSIRPSSATTSGCWCKDAAAVAERLDWSAEPWRALTERAEAVDRQEGPRAVPPAAPRADRARERARNGRPGRAHGQGARGPPPRSRGQALDLPFNAARNKSLLRN